MTLEPASVMLTGRTAVVTGAAAGIGEAAAMALAGFGADVAVCDRDAENLKRVVAAIEEVGRRAPSAVLDVRDADAVASFLSSLERVDVLVNNAGGGFKADFVDVNAKGQDALMRENFDSVTHFIRGVVSLMTKGGSIINITSIEAFRASPGYAIYGAMKAAVESLTRSLALELGSKNIRVNCIAPDVIPTPGVGELGEPHTPLPIKAHPDDVAAAVVFLAGDLSRFVTGTTLHVDGGNFAAGGWHRTADGSFEP